MNTRRPLLLLLAASLALLAGCDNPVDTSPNLLPYLSKIADVGGDQDSAEGDSSDAGGACDCLAVGQWFRFDTLAVTSLDEDEGHPVIDTLNNLWTTDIAREELNLIFEVVAVSDTEVTMRSFSGAHYDEGQGEGFCLLPVTAKEIVFPREGCRLLPSNLAEFVIYAGTESHPKNCSTTLPVPHVIPVSSARLEGTLSPSCDAISAGEVIEGGLGEDELGAICTCLLLPNDPASKCEALDPSFGGACPGCNAKYQSLKELLVAFGDLQWKCQTGSGGRSACLTATWSALALDQSPPVCGQ